MTVSFNRKPFAFNRTAFRLNQKLFALNAPDISFNSKQLAFTRNDLILRHISGLHQMSGWLAQIEYLIHPDISNQSPIPPNNSRTSQQNKIRRFNKVPRGYLNGDLQ
ncbi:hypothetical protein A4D02_17550 [Niastella koreensis]|uniref:Uncharacterized protein n=2 Tax=Niastella koreensis TaxID=354356 RepID=G8TCX4_NIAKG|nr:hypothetical protein Niako_0802 [Niastella koreensis GR20-10]OQP39135.1 hypothetical protein A4D02_17550 [Niastella koreensis]